MKKHAFFYMIFMSVAVLVLWDLVTMRGLFIGGDNFVQFYPWFKTYAGSIKEFRLPFWTGLMQSGFPLVAEGQVGGYYPLNILFFFLLPFDIAYNYAVVFHFILGGVCMYFLARKLGTDRTGGTLAALIFCFGSSYAGCFYNIITLRTLAWTPLVFLLFEHYFEKKKILYVILAGLVLGFQFLAGFVQLAFYSGVFYLLYFIYKIKLLKERPAGPFFGFFLFCVTAGIIFLPQFLLTARLAGYSARPEASLGFALWGSFNPAGIVGTVFPMWAAFTRNDLYISVFGLLFLIASFYMMKQDRSTRPFCLVMVVSFLMALGKYDPLYVMLLKVTNFYTFRNPSKFLFFTVMAASVLAGKGFTAFFGKDFPERAKALKTYMATLVSCAAVFLASKFVLQNFKEQVISAGRWCAEKMVYGQAHHRYDLATYLRKVESFYSLLLEGVSLTNVFNIAAWILLAAAFAWALVALKREDRPFSAFSKSAIFFIIIVDLFIFSFKGTGFRGNIEGLEVLRPTHTKILEYIKSDEDTFRVMPYDIASERLPRWIMPNANMIYGIESIAAYTPLVSKKYSEELRQLEVADNSLGLLAPGEGAFEEDLDIIRLLNVKYVVAAEKLGGTQLQLVENEGGIYLYELKEILPRVFTARALNPLKADRKVAVKTVDYRSGLAYFKVDMPYEGFLVFSESGYPGWEVYIDGKKGKVLPLSLVQAVKLEKGEHSVKFVYSPYGTLRLAGHKR